MFELSFKLSVTATSVFVELSELSTELSLRLSVRATSTLVELFELSSLNESEAPSPALRISIPLLSVVLVFCWSPPIWVLRSPSMFWLLPVSSTAMSVLVELFELSTDELSELSFKLSLRATSTLVELSELSVCELFELSTDELSELSFRLSVRATSMFVELSELSELSDASLLELFELSTDELSELSFRLSARATSTLVELSLLSVAVAVFVSLPLFEKLPLPESATSTLVELFELSELSELSELFELSTDELSELSLRLSAKATSTLVELSLLSVAELVSLPLFEKLPLPESATSTFVELFELSELSDASLLELFELSTDELSELSLRLSARATSTLVELSLLSVAD